MIEVQKDKDSSVERSSKPKKIYRTVEPAIGRIIRLEVDERSWGIELTSGKLLSIRLNGDEDLEFAIEGAERIELDTAEEVFRVFVLQSDSGKWKKIYESKDWEGEQEL